MPVPVLIEEPPEFEFEAGLFYVHCGATGTCRAYRPRTFFAALAGMAGAARKYRLSGGEVVPFKRPKSA